MSQSEIVKLLKKHNAMTAADIAKKIKKSCSVVYANINKMKKFDEVKSKKVTVIYKINNKLIRKKVNLFYLNQNAKNNKYKNFCK